MEKISIGLLAIMLLIEFLLAAFFVFFFPFKNKSFAKVIQSTWRESVKIKNFFLFHDYNELSKKAKKRIRFLQIWSNILKIEIIFKILIFIFLYIPSAFMIIVILSRFGYYFFMAFLEMIANLFILLSNLSILEINKKSKLLTKYTDRSIDAICIPIIFWVNFLSLRKIKFKATMIHFSLGENKQENAKPVDNFTNTDNY